MDYRTAITKLKNSDEWGKLSPQTRQEFITQEKTFIELADAKNIAIKEDIAKNLEDLGGVKVKNVVANGGVKFTAKQVESYVTFATKQNDKSKVMLGMWDGGEFIFIYFKSWKIIYIF